MELTTLNSNQKRYGFTEKKKAYIDLLISQIIDAEAIVQQQLAIVTAISQKSIKYQGYLLDAENYKAQSLNNKNPNTYSSAFSVEIASPFSVFLPMIVAISSSKSNRTLGEKIGPLVSSLQICPLGLLKFLPETKMELALP